MSVKVCCRSRDFDVCLRVMCPFQGFCRPPEIEGGDGEGSGQFEDVEGTGLGEGDGIKDVSDQIENEDQVRACHGYCYNFKGCVCTSSLYNTYVFFAS